MLKIKDIETWFFKALDIPEEEREGFLQTHLQDQPHLLKEVLELVQSDETGALTQLKNELAAEPEDLKPPKIDRYQLEEEMGRGGMAMVFRGRRTDGVFDHEVAVKILKGGMITPDFVYRFNQERNLLGKLKHENIAQIYDGGITSDDRPYFIMELVKGQDIITWAEEKELSLRERLELFLSVCKAIQYAHQNLVIHRDIKPSNILINERGQVKLTDFGIAQIIDQDDTSESKNEPPMFTPGYASPEQLERTGIDIRTDVYQLGKVLKKLTENIKVPEDAKFLMLQALRKDKSLRYQSVGDLITDVTNFLQNKPLEARNGGWVYITTKFVHRNRFRVIASALAILVLISFTLVYIVRIKQANEKALFEKNIAESSVNLMLNIFTNAYPSYSKGDTLNIFDLLHIGDSLLVKSESDLLSGRFSQLIAEIYAGYNQDARAVPYYEQAIGYLKRDSATLSESRNMLFAAQAALANTYLNLGNVDSAYYYLLESEKYAGINELMDKYRPGLYGRLAWLEVNRGNPEKADTLYMKAITLMTERGDDLRLLANQLAYYGRFLNYYDTPGRKDQIDSMYQASEKIFKDYNLDSVWVDDYARLVNYQGLFNLDLGEYDKAEQYFSQAYEINYQLFGLENLATLDNLNNLGQILRRKKEYLQARENYLTCWNAAQKIGISLWSSLVYFHNYASTFNLTGQYDVAYTKLDSLVSLREKYVAHDLVRLNNARFELTKSCIGTGNYTRAQTVIETIISSHISEFGEKGDMDLKAAVELVRLYKTMGEEVKATEAFEKNKDAIIRRLGEESELLILNKEALDT